MKNRGTASQFQINQVAEMGQAAKVFQWLSLVQFLPGFLSWTASVRALPLHTWTGSVWFICSRMS